MIRFHAAALALLLVTFAPVSVAASGPALVTVEDVRERLRLPGLRILDLRNTAAYSTGHAEGAVSTPMSRFRAALAQGLMHDVLAAADLSGSRDLLLIHHDSAAANFAEAAWLAWELGQRRKGQVSVLYGGMRAWQAAGLQVTGKAPRQTLRRTGDARPSVSPAEPEPLATEVATVRACLALCETEGLPTVSVAGLLGDEDTVLDRVALLDRLKQAPIPWRAGAVVITGETIEAASALWLLAGEVVGVEQLRIAESLWSRAPSQISGQGSPEDGDAPHVMSTAPSTETVTGSPDGAIGNGPRPNGSAGAWESFLGVRSASKLPTFASITFVTNAPAPAPMPLPGRRNNQPEEFAGPAALESGNAPVSAGLRTTSAPSSWRFRIQLGAFRTRDEADSLHTQLMHSHSDLLSGVDLVVQKRLVKGTIYYRLRGGPYEDRASAEAACTAFVRRRQDCMVWARSRG